MTSPMMTFDETMKNLVTNSILTPISVWLKEEKGFDVSVEELMQCLSIPKFQKSTVSVVTAPSFPPHMSNSSPAVTTKKKSKEETVDGPKCQYVFKRGSSKGSTCPKVAQEGSSFCKDCAKKNKKEEGENSPTSTAKKTSQPVIQGFGFVNGLKKANTTSYIRGTEIPDVFEDTATHLLLKRTNDGTKDVYVAYALKESDGKIRGLTESDKEVAVKRGFTYDSNEKQSTTISKPPAIKTGSIINDFSMESEEND
jgi:hypothetical protein